MKHNLLNKSWRFLLATLMLLSTFGVNVAFGALTAHEPGVYEKAAVSGGYGIDLTTVGTDKYEVYYFSANSKYGAICTGVEKAQYRLSALDANSEHILLASSGNATGWHETCDWIDAYFPTTGFAKSDYTYTIGDTYGEFFSTTINGGTSGYTKTCFIKPYNQDVITIKVKGYTEFAILAKDNSTSKYLTVTVDDADPVSWKSATLSRRSVALTTAEHTIVIACVGTSANNIYGFSLKVPAADPYTVTFNANGGTCGTSSLTEASAGAGVTLPGATPADEATQELLGWAVSSTETDPAKIFAVGAKYEPSADVTLYAIYGAKTVKSAIVYANTKGATNSNPTLYTEGVGVPSFANLDDVDGWHFTGWNPSSISASATGEQTITAEWTKAPRTMFSIVMKDGISKSLAKGGGEQALDATYATVTGGAALVKNIDASNDGKMQLTNNGIYFNGGNAYLYIALDEELHEGDVITFTSNSTNQICFTLDDTRETSLTTADKSYTIPAESPLIGAAELYVWRTSSSGTNVKTLTIKTIEDYVAPVYHSVTFDMQGATSAAIEAQSVKNGKKAVKPEDPTKTGFDFVKWVVASTEADYDFDAAVTADVALKAVWEEITTSFTVTYNANGGTCGTASATWTGGDALVLPGASKDGMLFDGWFDAATGGNKIVSPYTPTADIELFAHYSYETKLKKAVFSNGFDAFINEDTKIVDVYYLDGTAEPTLTAGTASLAACTVTETDGKLVVTAPDDSFVEYTLTKSAVTPAAVGEYTFDAVPSWVKAPYGYDASKGIKFAKNADDGRIQLGNTRQYYFVEACEKLELTWKTSVRPVKVYRNGTEVSASTVDGKLTIPCDVDNACMIAVVSNQTSGDGGFSAARVAAYEVTCPSSVAITGSKTYTVGATITLTAAQTGGNGTITYQWYKDDVAIVGATSATFEKVSTMEDGGNYVCKVNQTDCEEVASEAYAVVVNKIAVTKVEISAAEVEIKVGETTTVTATITPANATYPDITDWQMPENNGIPYFSVTGGNPTTLTALVPTSGKSIYATADGKKSSSYSIKAYYEVVFANCDAIEAKKYYGSGLTLPTPTGGNEPFLGWYDNAEFTGSAVSNSSYKPAGNVTLYAKWTLPDAETPTITTQPVGATYDEGAPMTALTVVAAVSEGTLSYQWYKGSSVIEGATAAEFTPTEAGTYKVVVTNTLAGHNPASTTSENAVITVNRAAVEQSDVTVSTTWNWANAGSSVDKGDGVSASGVLANEDGITNDVTFNSQALVYAGRYPNRGGYFQGGSISFHTTIAGMVAVQFSNTGGNAARTARINGSYDAEIASTGGSAKATFTSFVEAGDVVIEGIQVSDEATKDIRIYSITFTAATRIRSGLTAGDFGTMCQAKPIAALGGAIVYEIEKKNAIGLDLVEAEFPLVAGKPYIYQATAETVSVIYGGEAAAEAPVAANGLVGRLSTAEGIEYVPADMYVIQLNNLRKVAADNSIKFLADRAYINYDAVEENAVEDDPQAAPRRRVTMGGVSADVVTSIDEISAETGATKFIENGILYIRRGGKVYSAQGQLVK